VWEVLLAPSRNDICVTLFHQIRYERYAPCGATHALNHLGAPTCSSSPASRPPILPVKKSRVVDCRPIDSG
jgi:hypothetical protein